MWILDNFGDAIKSDLLNTIHWKETSTFTCVVTAQTDDKNILLKNDLKDRDDAKAYIADLVHKLNGDTPEPDLILYYIRGKLKVIHDSLYPPEKRDIALTHTKELISYVDSLYAEIEGGNYHD